MAPRKLNKHYTVYKEVTYDTLLRRGGGKKLPEEFIQLTNDFDRVCFLLKVIGRPGRGRGAKCLGLPGRGELGGLVVTKSDASARKCLEWCSRNIDTMDYKSAISAVNRAYFYALSQDVKLKVLQTRCQLFLEMEYYRECLHDANSALEVGFCSKRCADLATNLNRSLSDGGSG
nr:hypothetical transcript [Hymenolepis microstoma]